MSHYAAGHRAGTDSHRLQHRLQHPSSYFFSGSHGQDFRNLIAGEWVAPQTGAYFENRNPADTSDLIGRFPDSDRRRRRRGGTVGTKRDSPAGRARRRPSAATSCGGSATCWSSGRRRIADAMTREMGKVLAETRGDVQEGIDTAYYAATEGRRLFGHAVPSELRSKWAMSYRRPIGVVGLITPFNFPLAIPTWKMFPALLCGNSVVIKPSEDVPHTVHLLVEILLEAGMPPEVIQLVHGGVRRWARRWWSIPMSRSSRLPGPPRPGRSSARPAVGCTSGCRWRWAARTR